MHVDMEGAEGKFFNVIVPVHIPQNHEARLYLDDNYDNLPKGSTSMDPHVGIVLGGDSAHGTGECNYRNDRDVRLSISIYMADITKDNVELMAEDPTSLWPAQEDEEWYMAQQRRGWPKDGKNSLKNDKGRKSLKVDDAADDCTINDCETDNQGKHLRCAITCCFYLNDDVYYPFIEKEKAVLRAETVLCNESPYSTLQQ